jgi:hypothetical protein
MKLIEEYIQEMFVTVMFKSAIILSAFQNAKD